MTKVKRLIPFIYPLLAFILILLAMNGYQYLKLKRDVSENMIKGIGENELRELKTFFVNSEGMLLLLRDWGKNDVLLGEGVTPLNKKLIPLLNRQQMISGVTIAGDSGDEYLLYGGEKNFVTRQAKVGEGGHVQTFTEWNEDVVQIGGWQENISYDPRQTNWYRNAGTGKQVQWTGVYPLASNKQTGTDGFHCLGHRR